MIVEDAVPVNEEQDKKISVVGNTAVVQPSSLTKYTITFKQYVFCHIHKEFGLWQESGDPHHPETEFFSSSFFQNFMIDMLFLTPMSLWNCVLPNDQLDNIFGLGGAALAVTLKDFIQGYYCKLSDYDYLSILSLISCMQTNPIRRDWLVMLQQSLMAQGHAGLPPFYTFV
ncbi:hypothetical protein V8B97DRAFT_2103610 [Scleroderma yunnanense]